MQNLKAGLFGYFVLTLIFICAAFAQKDTRWVNSELADYTKKVLSVKQKTEQKGQQERPLVDLLGEIDSIQQGLTDYKGKVEPLITDLKAQIERLGKVPDTKSGAAPEAESVSKERERLNKILGEYDGAYKEAALLQTRLVQLRRRIQQKRQEIFANEIFRRYDSPLGYQLWQQVFSDAATGVERVHEILVPEKDKIASTLQIIGALLSITAIWVILLILSNRLTIKYRTPPYDVEELKFFKRTSYAILVSCIRFAPWVITTLLLYPTFNSLGLFTTEMERLARTVVFGLLIFFIVSAIVKTLLAPNRPIWRVYPFSNHDAKIIYRLTQLIVFVFSVNLVWTTMNEVVKAPLSLTVGQSFIASLVFAILLASLSFVKFHAKPEEEGAETSVPARSKTWPLWFKIPLTLIAIVILVASAMGYISFAKFLAAQIVITGALIIIALLFYIAIQELSSDIVDGKTLIGRWFSEVLEFDELRRKQASYIIGLILQLLLITCVVPAILLEWGFSWRDIQTWLVVAFFGIQVGPVNISLSTIVIAIGLFFVGLVMTKFIQRWLEQGPLTVTNFQDGVADSVRTGVGYIGFVLSLLLAISYVGVDFTNIAIVAGALSVGIGFGLQSIVNNFVSGLILLVERPIKAGDWVVVGDNQGRVRKVSVRYTEIETFDRSSVIIPNSDLISTTITNWTHGNTVGRVIINVGVSYSADAREVYDLLLKIGKDHPDCLTYPSPTVVFEEFGASSLDFSLRIFIANIGDVLKVRTELRMTILEEFRDKNIEIPFPQRDLHIKGGSVVSINKDNF